MTLLAGTDFTEPSRRASRAAARLAAALSEPLHLVHVAHLPGTGTGTRMTPMTLSSEEMARRQELLRAEVAALAPLGARVQGHLLEGLPDERLLDHAEEIEAQCIVIGPEGDRRHTLGDLGSMAIRVVKSSKVPVLVVRDDACITRWIAEKVPLRTIVGLDGSRPSQAALGWLRTWRKAGRIDLVGVHVVEAGGETPSAADLSERLEGLSEGKPRIHTIPLSGDVAEQLASAAAAERADLLVVGTRHRGGLGRLVHGSVSIATIGLAPCNVVAVPLSEHTTGLTAPAAVRRVLVPYDGSELALQALPWACSLLANGGEIVVLHVVVPHGLSAQVAAAEPLGDPTEKELARIRAKIGADVGHHVPAEARDRGVHVRVELEPGFDPGRVVADSARRLEVDAICMTTHGRTGLLRAVLGSVAHAVLRRAPVPVLIVPPPALS